MLLGPQSRTVHPLSSCNCYWRHRVGSCQPRSVALWWERTWAQESSLWIYKRAQKRQRPRLAKSTAYARVLKGVASEPESSPGRADSVGSTVPPPIPAGYSVPLTSGFLWSLVSIHLAAWMKVISVGNSHWGPARGRDQHGALPSPSRGSEKQESQDILALPRMKLGHTSQSSLPQLEQQKPSSLHPSPATWQRSQPQLWPSECKAHCNQLSIRSSHILDIWPLSAISGAPAAE